jgi:hypothetical protein
MHWREWFAIANRHCIQQCDVAERHVEQLKESWCSTEAMYQAFKARMLEEGAKS